MSSAGSKIEVRESAIEGVGVFALEEFKEGDLVSTVNVVREITDSAPLRPDCGELFEHCAYPDGRVVLYGMPDRHLNHNCDPNAYEAYERGVAVIRARRSIQPGDEVTIDYNINQAGGDSWACACSAQRCRSETLGSYFRLPIDVQIEYLPFLADWFIERHRDQIDEIRNTITEWE